MQRLLLQKLGSKVLRDSCGKTRFLQSISPKINPTSNLQNLPPIHPPRHFFSDFSVPSYSWRIQNGVVAERIRGVFANTTLKVLRNGLADCRVGFQRNQIFGRGFTSLQARCRGWQSWFQRQKADSVVLGLVLTNAAVFILWRIADPRFMHKNFTISLENIRSGRLHTMITNAFSHIDNWHLISNMIGLYFFGKNIGINCGTVFLLKLYLAGAVVGSIFYLVDQAFIKNGQKWNYALGASGAVNAIMLLDIFLHPKAIIYLELFIPVPAALMGAIIIGQDMVRIYKGDSNVSGEAHLGGAVVAALAWARIRKGWI